MELWDKLQIALFSGIVAILGTMFGGFVVRTTELEKWRRNNIGPSSQQFLQLLEKARLETTNIIYEENLEEPHRGIKITLAYLPVIGQARIVRLFMRGDNKDRFETLANETHSLHASVELGQERLGKIETKINEIQDILEEETTNTYEPFLCQ